MSEKIDLDTVFVVSENVVAREIEGELLVVPLVAGIGDVDDALYTLNETGKAIWKLIDGKRSLHEIVDVLSQEFDSESDEITADIAGLAEELSQRKMIIEVR